MEKFLLFSKCVLSCHLIKILGRRKNGCHFSELSVFALQEQRDHVEVGALFHSLTKEFYNENLFLDFQVLFTYSHNKILFIHTQWSNQPKNILLSLQIVSLCPGTENCLLGPCIASMWFHCT